MLTILLIRTDRLPTLKEAITQTDWQLWEVVSFSIADIFVTRILLSHDEPIPDWVEVVVEATLPDTAYCVECARRGEFKPLQPHNQSGYCYRHRDKDPRRSQRRK